MGRGKCRRKTLFDIKEYPKPQELYEKLINSPGWVYKSGNRKRFLCRDRALASLLYLGDFRIEEVIPLTMENFEGWENPRDFVLVKGVQVGKKKRVEYREAKLPLRGERRVFTELVIDYLNILKPKERLFPWNTEKRRYPIKGSFYKTKDGKTRQRYSVQMVGTHRAWQIINALLPDYTQHWLRAFGYSFDYDVMEHDIMAVSDKTKADPRSLQPYLRRRYEKYPVR